MSKKRIESNISEALGIEVNNHVLPPKVIEDAKEVVPYEEEKIPTDQDQDYILARSVLRNLITKGNDAIDEIAKIAHDNESARGYEVVATLIKTVAETTKDLYNVQKMKKDLVGPSPDSDPRDKTAKTDGINVEQAVFVGSTAELLDAIKNRKENGPLIDHKEAL